MNFPTGEFVILREAWKRHFNWLWVYGVGQCLIMYIYWECIVVVYT